MIEGIDVASYQGNVDWQQVAASGRDFGIIKATEDDDYTNLPQFPREWNEIREAGLIRGVYHFARPNMISARDSVHRFLATIDTAGGLLPGDFLAFDMEVENPDGALAYTIDWLDECKAQAGFEAWFYSSYYYIFKLGLLDERIAARKFWCALYNNGEQWPEAIPPWTEVAMHQYAVVDAGVVPGVPVPAKCDVNRFAGTREQLAATGKPGQDETPNQTFERLYWGPITRLANDLANESHLIHSNKALHAAVSNAITLHKIAHGAELP